jgi:hypothetical protein
VSPVVAGLRMGRGLVADSHSERGRGESVPWSGSALVSPSRVSTTVQAIALASGVVADLNVIGDSSDLYDAHRFKCDENGHPTDT